MGRTFGSKKILPEKKYGVRDRKMCSEKNTWKREEGLVDRKMAGRTGRTKLEDGRDVGWFLCVGGDRLDIFGGLICLNSKNEFSTIFSQLKNRVSYRFFFRGGGYGRFGEINPVSLTPRHSNKNNIKHGLGAEM